MTRFGICGFYGAGNLGDEAMLAGLLGWLADKPARPTVFLDYGARRENLPPGYPGFPGVTLAAAGDRGAAEQCDVLLIGGGGLGVGFGWNLLPFALHAGRKVATVGMTFSHQWTGNGHDRARDLNRQVLASFDFVATRDAASRERLAGLGIGAELGSDPALLLPVSTKPRRPDRVSLFLRGGSWTEHFTGLARGLIEGLHAAGAEVLLGACCAGDGRPCELLRQRYPFAQTRETDFHWRRGLDLAATSALVVSLGRLHPLVLAAHAGTPSVGVDVACHHPPGRIEGFCRDAGIPCLGHTGEGLGELVMAAWESRHDAADGVKRRAAGLRERTDAALRRVWALLG